MDRRDDDQSPREQIAPEQIIEAVARNDGKAVERLTAELARHEDASILELEHDAERAARSRGDAERVVDRVRNLFQAILLNRLLRRRRD